MNLRKTITTAVLILFVSQSVFAQEDQAETKSGPRKQLAKIFLTGLGGAVLGLSTLSFYGRPQENLRNIAYGFALGVIAGTVYVTYYTTKRPKEYLSEFQSPQYLNETSRENLDFKPSQTLLTYNFTF